MQCHPEEYVQPVEKPNSQFKPAGNKGKTIIEIIFSAVRNYADKYILIEINLPVSLLFFKKHRHVFLIFLILLIRFQTKQENTIQAK